MRFPPQFLDEIRARVPLADTIGKRVRLARRGREHVGLCPFHNEKTPSFTVNEDKGFFHCFGCGAHGDVIGFAMRADNLTFPEAVERLAGTAGLALPERTPEDAAHARERTSLYTVIEAACAWFEAQLAGAGGKAAREYLECRGLDGGTIEKFRLGWAPADRHALERELAGQGVSETMMVGAGLLIGPEGGGAPYDRFRGRIIFPITDRGGRVVAFGGRLLAGDGPKYVNSPETTLFHKGTMLYGLALARKPAREAREVIVAEGYMDVIALHRAGFANAVAPLGTALTETQIGELWRLAPEPVICFDGDEAGRKAAYRAADRALPLLQPGRSLRFAALPPGTDPDSLIAERGAQAFRDALGGARPLADILWEIEAGRGRDDTPERRAAREARLLAHARRIADTTVRGHYERHFRTLLWESFRGGKRTARRRGGAPRLPEPRMADSLGSSPQGVSERRERHLVAMVLDHPELLGAIEEEFAAVDIASPELDGLRRAILDAPHRGPDLDSAALKRHLSAQGASARVERLSATHDWSERRLEDGSAKPGVALVDLERIWRHLFVRHSDVMKLKTDLKSAEKALGENMTEETQGRFDALRRRLVAEQHATDDDIGQPLAIEEAQAEIDALADRILGTAPIT